MRELGEKLGLAKSSAYFNFIDIQNTIVLKSTISAMLIGALVSFVLTIYFSHKAAGPLYRLKKYFIDFKDNKKTKLKFRSNDYLDDLSDTINDALFEEK